MNLNLKQHLSGSKLAKVLEKPTEANLPYDVHVFQNLLDEQTFRQLRDDIHSSVKLKMKDNDLYKFKQSKDLVTEIPAKKLTQNIHNFIDCMFDKPMIHNLESLTGTGLSTRYFDITASRYDVGNYLLCHNDDIKDDQKNHRRALAFVYYLNSRPWTSKDGGSLTIFRSDSSGEPVEIINRIYPNPNTLVIFETTSTSWHSVEEVYCKDDFRLSINGWYHTEDMIKVDEADRHIEPCPFKFIRPIPLDDQLERFFHDYFNSDYLMDRTCMAIRRKFKRNSEINLTNFLKKERFVEISEAIREATNNQDNLEHIGPYNKRNYQRIRIDSLPQVCKNLYHAFQSELFFMFLSRITGLDLQPPSIKSTDIDNAKSSDENDSDDSDSDSDDEDEELDLEDESDEDCDDEEDLVAEINKEEQSKALSLVDQYKGEKSSTIQKEETIGTEVNEGRPTTSKQKFKDEKKDILKKRSRTADPLARHEFRHLDAGSYTLIHDYGFEMGEKSALDVILHFNHDFEVNFEDGGYISYIDGAPEEDLHDMDCELLTVEPKSNCLSLAYRCDEGTCRFLKYISKSHKAAYQDLHCVYYE